MGAKPGDLFKNKDDAAKDFGKYYNGLSILVHKEISSGIYKVVGKDGSVSYTYTAAKPEKGAESTVPKSGPNGEKIEASAHTHAQYTGNDPDPNKRYDDDHFSNSSTNPGDIQLYDARDMTGYVATPNGEMQKYDPDTKTTTVIATDMPSDPNEGSNRKNNISPFNATVDSNDIREKQTVKPDAIPKLVPPPPPKKQGT